MLFNMVPFGAFASSHREAPLIANDPLADNTDLYAFRSPDDPNKITIIANYVPGQLPQGGPNYYSFGENILYEIHIDNDVKTPGDDITYRFTFKKQNEDPTTFFNIRLGKQNLKTTFQLEKSTDGGKTFTIITRNGVVPPPNIGPRSISGAAGLKAPNYESLIRSAITTTSTGEKVFCGTADDPFFVDLGGIFDLGDAPRTTGTKNRDGLACLNVSTIAMQIDISALQKNHKSVREAKNILDPDYVIGVWASASRKRIKVFGGGKELSSGPWVQVSRLGMPLTNEAIIPVGMKDYWNSLTPYEDLAKLKEFGNFFYNPELALYMDDDLFGGAVPALSKLRIQKKSLTVIDFTNGADGLYPYRNDAEVKGTALDPALFGKLLLPAPGSPRSFDIWPIFNTGVPNLPPYQLAIKKEHVKKPGKPFINNFLPNGGDMLRLNMAVPPTRRDDPKFSSLGLVQAAVIGLTDPRYNSSKTLQFIPNMDGFPNGRRLEDDVVRIELQAVSGIVLAAIGYWYDDYNFGGSPVTQDLLDVLSYDAGIVKNDAPMKRNFPYVPSPWPGTHNCDCDNDSQKSSNRSLEDLGEIPVERQATSTVGLAAPEMNISAYPNPINTQSTIKYSVDEQAQIRLAIYDIQGKLVNTVLDKKHEPGVYTVNVNTGNLAKGTYMVVASKDGVTKQTIQLVKE